MATIQEVVDQVESLDTSVQEQTAQSAVTKSSADSLVTSFQATKDKVDNELNNVDNTADADKPVSLAAQVESDTKQDILVDGDNISTVNGVSLLSGVALVIARGQVEIPVLAYENRGDLRTPVLPVPLTGDVVNIPNLGEFQYITSFEYIDDDETVFQSVTPLDNVTPIGQWVLSKPAYDWLEAQKLFSNAVLWEWMEDEQLRFNTH